MDTIVKIDRSCPFDPASFSGLGKDWSLGEEDECSLSLTEINLTNIRLETCLKDKEKRIDGNERIKRLKELGRVRFDIKIFQTFWKNKDLIPQEWKNKVDGRTLFVSFDGTELYGPDGRLYTVFLFWSGKRWRWSPGSIEGSRGFNEPSAVLINTS
ncbi:MAG: hypothetical protein Q8Q95_00600 [bacterium]|nr:hypothetical protein [bacterium]